MRACCGKAVLRTGRHVSVLILCNKILKHLQLMHILMADVQDDVFFYEFGMTRYKGEGQTTIVGCGT